MSPSGWVSGCGNAGVLNTMLAVSVREKQSYDYSVCVWQFLSKNDDNAGLQSVHKEEPMHGTKIWHYASIVLPYLGTHMLIFCVIIWVCV